MFFVQEFRYGPVLSVSPAAAQFFAEHFDSWYADYLQADRVTCEDLCIVYVGF